MKHVENAMLVSAGIIQHATEETANISNLICKEVVMEVLQRLHDVRSAMTPNASRYIVPRCNCRGGAIAPSSLCGETR